MSKKLYTSLSLTPEEEEEYAHDIIYAASSDGNEKRYMWYWVVIYVCFCLPFVLLYGVGLLFLLYTPVIGYIAFQDISTRKLFITSDSVIYISQPPAFCPCFGLNRSEKHVLLSLVTDVIHSQNWLAACFTLNTVSIENAGQGGGAKTNVDISFVGLKNSKEFKKLLLRAAAAKRNGRNMSRDDVENFLQDSRSVVDGPSRPAPGPGVWSAVSPPTGESTLTNEKLDQLNATMGRMENLLSRFLEHTAAAPPAYQPADNQ